MSKNNNRNKDFWQSIGAGITAVALSVGFLGGMVQAVTNSWAKFFERRGVPIGNKNISISTTEAPIPSTELDIEEILQATIPTTVATEPTIDTTEPTIDTTEPTIDTTEPTIGTAEPTIDTTEPTIETTITTQETNESTIETTIPTITIEDSFNELNIEKYIKAIDNIKVNYKHKKYYPTKNDTFKIFADATTTAVKCDYQFNGDIEGVVNKLLENSQKYISENPKYVIPFKDESSQDKELITQQIWFEITLYQILGNWKNNTNNVNEDFCSLENYNIMFSFDEEEYENLLAYTTHNTLVIFPKRIQLHAAMVNETFENTLYDVMNRQLNIVRQRACKCRIYREQSYFQIPTKTLTDAASEAETKYYDNPSMYSLNYYDEKQSEELLLALGLFRDGVTYDDYYNAIYNSDLNSLHKFFNATTEEEINRLYTILYAIDAVNFKNDLLLTYYDEDDWISFNDITTFVGHSYKIDIFKIILKNLIQYTNTHNDFTIEDNLIMYKYIEGLIINNSHILFDVDYENDTVTVNYENDFKENIYTLRNIYYEFICNKYNISIEKIKELESTDVNSVIFNVDRYCHDNYSYMPQNHLNTVKNLVERFPLLKAIANTQKSLTYELELFGGISR